MTHVDWTAVTNPVVSRHLLSWFYSQSKSEGFIVDGPKDGRFVVPVALATRLPRAVEDLEMIACISKDWFLAMPSPK